MKNFNRLMSSLGKGIKSYNRESFTRDLTAGLTVAIVAIPQSMAYAIIAGVDVKYGLYTAFVCAILGSLMGSSNHLVTGPTNASSLLLAACVSKYSGMNNYMSIVFLATFFTGMYKILFALLKAGKLIDFLSRSVLVGFTAGAGIIIAMGQLPKILGLPKDLYIAPSLVERTINTIINIKYAHLPTVYIAAGTLILIIALDYAGKKLQKKLPSSLIVLLVMMTLVALFQLDRLGIQLTGTVPSTLALFKPLDFTVGNNIILDLIKGSFSIAIIGMLEALSISHAIALKSTQKISSNQEFLSQGLTNVISSFFQCFPSSGSFTRSAINYSTGALTKNAGIINGIIVGLALVLFGPFTRYIPAASLGAVIMLVAYGMVDKKQIKQIWQCNTSDKWILLATCIGTILLPNLTFAIYLGVILSFVFYIKDCSEMKIGILNRTRDGHFIMEENYNNNHPDRIKIINLQGNIYFGNCSALTKKLKPVTEQHQDIIIFRMRNITSIDGPALEELRVYISNMLKQNKKAILCGVRPDMGILLDSAGIIELVGQEQVFYIEKPLLKSTEKAFELASGSYVKNIS